MARMGKTIPINSKRKIQMTIELLHGDMFEVLQPAVGDRKAQLVFLDLPYGSTDCDWDARLGTKEVFELVNSMLAPNGAVVCTADMRFAVELISKQDVIPFRYDVIFQKTSPCGFANANKMPLRSHELMLVFYHKLPTYNPQKFVRNSTRPGITNCTRRVPRIDQSKVLYNISKKDRGTVYYNNNQPQMPRSILTIQNTFGGKSLHPTAKPYQLLNWLVQTYTNEGDLVIDPTFGSGMLARVCKDNNRDFIGTELSEQFYNQAISLQDSDIRKFTGNNITLTPYSFNATYDPIVFQPINQHEQTKTKK